MKEYEACNEYLTYRLRDKHGLNNVAIHDIIHHKKYPSEEIKKYVQGFTDGWIFHHRTTRGDIHTAVTRAKEMKKSWWFKFQQFMHWRCPKCGQKTIKEFGPGSAPGGTYYIRMCSRCHWDNN